MRHIGTIHAFSETLELGGNLYTILSYQRKYRFGFGSGDWRFARASRELEGKRTVDLHVRRGLIGSEGLHEPQGPEERAVHSGIIRIYYDQCWFIRIDYSCFSISEKYYAKSSLP